MSINELKLSQSEFLIYTSNDTTNPVEVKIIDEDVWVTQDDMAQIFGVNKPAISKHLKNIFTEGELDEKSVVSKMEITASDHKNYNVSHYNLDAIIAVGYRVNSKKATRFRQWATKVLKEYMIKGFAVDDERLKQNGQLFGKNYFQELLERIYQIRSSERVYYQKVMDIFAETSCDYDKTSFSARQFYATVQNKLEYAVTGKTAAEIIKERANHALPSMGLTTWKGVKSNKKIVQSDVLVAKNYLTEPEIAELNKLVSVFLDFAEMRALKGVKFSMDDWNDQLNSFLEFYQYDVLCGSGAVRRSAVDKYVKREYEKYKSCSHYKLQF